VNQADREHRIPPHRKLAYAVAVTLACLVLAEAGARLMGAAPKPEPRKPGPTINGAFWVSDELLGFRNRADGTCTNADVTPPVVVTTDERGYRNGQGWDPTGAGPIVLIVGDSTTFCGELEDSQTISSQLALRLQANGVEARVLNAGVRGYNTHQCTLMLRECLERFPDIAVAIYLFTGNDYVGNLDPASCHPAPTPALQLVDGGVRDVPMPPPAVPSGGSFPEQLAPPPPGLRVRFTDALRRRSALLHHSLGLLRDARGPSSLRVVPHIGAEDPLPRRWEEAVAWARRHGGDEVLEECLRRMRSSCEERGVAFLTTAFSLGEADEGAPSGERYAFDPRSHSALKIGYTERCARADVACVDVRGAFSGSSASYCAVEWDGLLDPHYGGRGAEVWSRAILPRVLDALRSR